MAEDGNIAGFISIIIIIDQYDIIGIDAGMEPCGIGGTGGLHIPSASIFAAQRFSDSGISGLDRRETGETVLLAFLFSVVLTVVLTRGTISAGR